MQYAHFSAHLFQHGHCRFWKSQEESECHLLSRSLSALMPSESQFIPRVVSFHRLNICRASLCQGQCLKSLPLCCTHSFFSHRTRKRHDSTSFMPPLETNDLKIYKICVFPSIIWAIGSRHFLFHNL